MGGAAAGGVAIARLRRLRLGAAALRRGGMWAVVLAACLLCAGSVVAPRAWAQGGGGITLLSSDAVSEFPDGMRFTADIDGPADIAEVAVRLRVGQRTSGSYEYLELDDARTTDGDAARASLFYRTNTSARYIPPGAIIAYSFEIEDADGNRLETETREFVYEDVRFEWDEVSNGIVTVAYHGPVEARAEDVLEATVETLRVMGPLLGAGVDDPIRVTMYNNWPEMRAILPPSSIATRRELITEGQAHSEEGVLLVLGGARRARGVASHEATHILVYRAGEGVLGSVPSWLNEGLAEYGNIDQGSSYDDALAYAIATDNLLPITAMESQPGRSEDIIIFYGQARSLVRFMVHRFGEDKMRELMATLKSGTPLRRALPLVYGLEGIEIENMWREELGATPRRKPDEGAALPTAEPTPALGLYSFDALRSGGEAATAVPAGQVGAGGQGVAAAQTAAPAATQAQPSATPIPTPAPAAQAAQHAASATATPAPAATPTAVADATGGGCNAPRGYGFGAGGAVDMSAAAAPAVWLAALWLRRRRGKRRGRRGADG